MPFDSAGKQSMLSHVVTTITAVSLHTGDPGAGAANEVSGGGYSRQTGSWAAPGADFISPSANIPFSGPPNSNATWFAVWAGSTRVGKGQLTSGDTTFNAAGEFSLGTGTRLRLLDPS